MPALTLQAHAKLNLSLDITGIAPNGYHLLDMVMHTISLCDTVTLDAAAGLTLDAPAWMPQGEDNLMMRAALSLQRAAGLQAGARMTLTKRIPAQAGMGGGSADAAAVLRGLNELWGLRWPMDRLCEIGLRLGSDVPFALRGGTARVRGVGEIIEPVNDAAALWFALAMPSGGGVDTAVCYRRYDEKGAANRRPNTDALIAALCRGDLPAMAATGGNALERAAVSLQGGIGDLLEQFRQGGAAFYAMTGSGAAVFAAFGDEESARRAVASLRGAAWSAVARSAAPREE